MKKYYGSLGIILLVATPFIVSLDFVYSDGFPWYLVGIFAGTLGCIFIDLANAARKAANNNSQ